MLRTDTLPLRLLATLASSFMCISTASADDQADFETLRGRAESGDAAAQAALAVRYRAGKGVAKDDAEALRWAHRAADTGNAFVLEKP